MSVADVLPFFNSTVIAAGLAALMKYRYDQRKLESDDVSAGRGADRHEIEVLRDLVRTLQDNINEQWHQFQIDMTAQRRSCEEEQQHLRSEVRSLHEELMGMRRQALADQISTIRLSDPSGPLVEATERLMSLP